MTQEEAIPTLRFSEFQDDWVKKKLGSVSELTSSKRVYLSDYTQEGVPFYRGKEITELKMGAEPSDVLFITRERYDDFKQKYGVPQVDDILITAVGTLGNVLRIKDQKLFYFKDGNLIWLRKVKESSRFLEIILQSNTHNLIKTSIGSTQKALTMVELRKLFFCFPSHQEQQKISEFLGAVDEKIAQLQKKKDLLEDYKKGCMQKLFSQEIRFTDDNDNPFPDWEEREVQEISNVVTGKTPSTTDKSLWNGDIEFITPTDILDDENIVRKTARTVKQVEGLKILPAKTVCYTCIASIGKMCMTGKPSITNQQINSAIVIEPNISEYLFYSLEYITPKIISIQANTTLPIINKTEFSKIKIPYPHPDEQKKIADFLSVLDDKISLVADELDKAKTFKKGLLQQMFV